MNDSDSKNRADKATLIKYWMDKSRESLESASSEYRAEQALTCGKKHLLRLFLRFECGLAAER